MNVQDNKLLLISTYVMQALLQTILTGHKIHYPPGNHQHQRAPARVIIKVSGHQLWWLAGGYNLKKGHFYRWLAYRLPDGCSGVFAQCLPMKAFLVRFSLAQPKPSENSNPALTRPFQRFHKITFPMILNEKRNKRLPVELSSAHCEKATHTGTSGV